MEVLGFTIEELRRLMAVRSVLLKILRSTNANQEIVAWIERGGSAEVVSLDDFRTDPGRERTRGAVGSSP
ncbi:hypothetical protein ABIF91_001704 [Bradyrhizobium sp. USDA 241]